mmetsp:Transcript_22282/g.33995  ORF Transcript_22282/g.33995 Transcript_22282/m.33995 type:complete len:117 (+) Transcript_22282:371-721(+)
MKINPSAVLLMAAPLRAKAFTQLKHSARHTRIPLAMVSSTANALLEQDNLPNFASIEPDQLSPAVSQLVEKLEKDFTSFESNISSHSYSPQYDDILPELEKMQFPLGYVCKFHEHK